MLRPAFQTRRLTRLAIIAAVAATPCLNAVPALAQVDAGPAPGADGMPQTFSATPNSSSDHYVQGKYNRSGVYVPPHYEPKAKPIFRGYFDQNKTTVKHGYFDTPKPVRPLTDQNQDADQPGRR